ncbi:putative ABC transport system permease protein [Mesonia hippocampi]|uniref:Putative ABC transport system permease protein n=1 Tax=Mesonia hippocampi TaxID=1628250 RepID=A0A840EJ32_9FLAO|nr:FtsX-like permease family protein [Mesonia hippocampi]MBB4119362.1 putative ABC transport system permease protein [Mesonia hippocampi]
MNLFKISYKNIITKPLNAILSILLLAFSVVIISLSFKFQKQVTNKIAKNTAGIDMVIGAKGSPLQLILSSVLHIDNPTGNINFDEAKKITKNPLIKNAIPISYGDNYKGYRIIGTTPAYKTLYGGELLEGKSAIKPLEVVIGATVAKKSNLKIGDSFVSSHGLIEEGNHHHDHHHLTVVGIYKTSHSVLDNLIVTPLETVWDMHHHHDHASKNKEITSVLVQFKSPMGFVRIPRSINEKSSMQAALTKFELDKLYNYTGIGVKIIQIMAIVILIISVFSIYISLYKIVKDRSYELALMRVYGANQLQLILLVFYEGLIISISGYILGLILSFAGGTYLYNYIGREYNYTIQQAFITDIDIYLFFSVLLLLSVITLFNLKSIISINIPKILSYEK